MVEKLSRKPNNASIAKITRPHVSDVLVRERLYALLDDGRSKPLLWITGPGGSGKSTLVTGWLDDRKLPCLWYQVDESDADPSSFFYYLGLAARNAAPRKKQLPLLTPEYLAAVATFARRFFEDLFNRLKPSSVVVFDNCQDVPAGSAFHDMLVRGIEAKPVGITVIMLSREEPPAQYARMRAGKMVGFVGWNELRFLPQEIDALIRGMSWQSCSEQACPTADLLYERTDGWAAGLVLLLESLRRASGLTEDAWVIGRSHSALALPDQHCQTVFDYFADEFLRKTDQPTCEFLFRTAFLPSMTVSMAQRLAHTDSAGRILRGLSRNHCFTDCRPGPEPVYHYHQLFREFLLTTARERFDAEEAANIRICAAVLLEEAGRVEEAVELFRDAGDTDAIARLILRHEASLLAQGRNETLGKWLACLPAAYLEQAPHLLRVAGLCRLPYSLAEARSYLEKSLILLEERADYAAALVVYGCLMEVVVIEGESLNVLDHYLERTCALVQHNEATADMAGMMAGTALFALTYRVLEHHTLPFWLPLAESAVMKAEGVADVLKLCNYLMSYYLFRGEFSRMTWLMDTLGSYRKQAEQVPALHLHCILLDAYHVANVKAELKNGADLARQGLELARESGVVIYNFWFSYLIAYASILLGEVETAAVVLDGMLPVGYPASAARLADVQYLRGGLALRRGFPSEALEHFRSGIDIFGRSGCLVSEVLCRISAAYACGALGNQREAKRYLRQAAQANWGGSWVCAFLGFFAKAVISFGEKEEADGREALRAAFAIGRERRIFMQPFGEPAVISRLCAEALASDIEADYVRDYIRRYNLAPDDSRSVEEWPWSVRIRTFGAFEIVIDGEPLNFSGKVQKKPLELLKALIAFGGRDVPQEEISDALWPEAEGDTAYQSFKFTLRQLRKLLGSDACILVSGGSVTLSSRCCHTDTAALQDIVARMRELLKTPDAGTGGRIALLADKALELYRGDFLRKDRKYPWVAVARERHKGRFIRLMNAAYDYYEETGQWEKAALLCERVLDADELDENFYRRLMLCLLKLNRLSAARAAYSRCRRMLATHLGMAPTAETESLYHDLLRLSTPVVKTS